MDVARLIRESVKRMTQTTLPVFQSQVYHHLETDPEAENGVQGFLQTLKAKTSNVDYVNLMLEKLQKYNLIDDKFKLDKKNDIKASKTKEKGNRFFGTGKFNKALRMYTKTLLKAEDQGLISIAYANRSAALFKLTLFEQCLEDIDRALANNYPENLKPKLLARKIRAAEMLRKSKKITKFYEEPPIIPSTQRNSTLECASNSVEVKNGKNRKCIIATRDIQVGEVIAVETPFVVSVKEAYLYHCHDCLNLVYNPIPCNHCTQALYCSETCKLKARNSYHKDECPILSSLRKLIGTNKYLLLAVKMAFHTQNEQFDEVLKSAENLGEDSVEDLFQLAMITAFMFDLVKKHTKRFDGPNQEAAESSFKDVLLTLVRLSRARATGINELCPDEFEEDTLTQEELACSIYPFFGLFRHSCCPNVFPQHHGPKRVLRSLRTIKKGQECLVSYGVCYTQEDKEYRQNLLHRQFHFKCSCRACTENWPQIDHLPDVLYLEEDFFFIQVAHDTNVEVAKRMISRKIEIVKRLEQFEPCADLLFQEKILLYCYDILGNKRLIQ